MKQKILSLIVCGVAVMGLFSCTKNDDLINTGTDNINLKLDEAGRVYTMTNEQEMNKIMVFTQQGDGSLSLDTMVATGGAGSGMGLGSQGAVTLSADKAWLLAVNAGDNTLSSFHLDSNGNLQLMDVVSSEGSLPVSVTVHDMLVYVVNSGSDNIAGFVMDSMGMLTHIPGSNQSLSAINADPAQIDFRPDGNQLLVTEKATNHLTYFVVDGGVAQKHKTLVSKGKTPFGFGFASNDNVIISNAEEEVEGASTVTSYFAQGSQKPKVSGPVENNQTASCWVAISHFQGSQVYVTNTGSNTISSYSYDNTGQLTLLKGVATSEAMAPTDAVISGMNEAYLFAVNVDSHSINTYSRNADGTLTLQSQVGGLPSSVAGLAAISPQ